MPEDVLTIGILQTDSVREEFVDEFGDYPDMFVRLLSDAAGDSVRFVCFDAQHGDLPAPDSCDGYLITGSRQSVYDPDPWISELAEFAQTARKAGRRIIGICFGHQLIAHFNGGKTAPADRGWNVGVHEANLLETLPWMEQAPERIALLASHQDQVVELPENARLIAGGDTCPVAGYVIDDEVLCFQGHPEFVSGYSSALMNMRRDLLGEEVYHGGMASLTRPTSELVVARWIISFLQAGRAKQ
jgi:GMP synthase-like glutamine amidotransferase